MAKKRLPSSPPKGHSKKSAQHTREKRIDFTDIPELTDAQLRKAKRVGRPKSANPKQLIAIRVSPKLLHAVKRIAKRRNTPYQTLMHQLLEKAVKDAA